MKKWYKVLGILILISLIASITVLPVSATSVRIENPVFAQQENAPTIGTVTTTGAVLSKSGYLNVTLSGTVTNLGGVISQTLYFEYGLTTSYGLTTTTKTINSSTALPYVFTKVIKIYPGAIYHFRLVARESPAPYIFTNSPDHIYNSQPTSIVSLTDIIADHGWVGEYEQGTIGEALSFGDVCYLKSDGKWWGTDADAEVTTEGILAICVVGGVPDATGVFLTKGYVRDDSWAWGTNGAALWIGNSPRTMVETAAQPAGSGDQIRLVGYTRTSHIIRFNPDETWLEIP